ncbi:hypothetical protein EPH_0044090 [Eimeria praecox]|uniref:Uncharacterized protein n=1 Tax=Eimeria praecox TaxID=51316 RepID=U6GB69_9EIME|nr:hypothetical protein EPH_0044090 [Eimeria praecox]
METMNIVDIDSGSSETEIFQAGRLPHAENEQGAAHKRRVRSQRAPWQTVIAVAACTALIFLVVKCTMQLASHKGTSVSDSDSDSCDTESKYAKGKKKGGGRRRWWGKKHSYSPLPQGPDEAESSVPAEQPSSDPSGSFPESHGIENPASDAPPPGHREWHTTRLPIGGTSADHYANISGMYDFPLLGTGEAYQPLRRVLKKAEEIMGALCFPHKGLGSSELASALIDVVRSSMPEVPQGESTTLMYEITRPPSVPCTGTVLLEVVVTKEPEAGLKDDEWLQ